MIGRIASLTVLGLSMLITRIAATALSLKWLGLFDQIGDGQVDRSESEAFY